MILIVHENADKVIRILQNDAQIATQSDDLNSEIIRVSREHPEELILWAEKKFQDNFDMSALEEIFHHDLIMCSYALQSQYLSEAIGYIDQWPFVKPDYKVTYPTWRMSTDMGGIKGRTLLTFEALIRKNKDFGYILNSVARLGQQNGLFCYSEPRLNSGFKQPEKLTSKAGTKELFQFVYQHYKWPWKYILFFCLFKYESKLPFSSFFGSFFNTKYFGKNFELNAEEVNSNKFKNEIGDSVDIVIPTLGRPEHLKQVLADLKVQSHLPRRVIVIEQNPDLDSKSEFTNLKESYPFELIHHFIHHSGACNARNMALKEVTADWIFFADDDIRVPPNLLKKCISELQRLGVDCLNINCKQPGQITVFQKIKQWASFGAGTSMVKSSFAKSVRFSEVFENGYGEDQDYGMQLRKKGCDVVYHPSLEITHLKAPVGGFRNKEVRPWERESLLPKPSPTLMAYANKYYSNQQLSGFRVELFLRYYSQQNIRNPWKYIQVMRARWKKSEKWAQLLEQIKSEPQNV